LSKLPNLISLARVVLSPFLLLVPEAHLFSFFLVLALSDALDGFFARLFKAQSELGKILDPLGDKVMLLCGLYVCTFRLGMLPSYLLYLLLVRDLFLLVGGALLLIKKGRVPSARTFGKLTTFGVSLLIILSLLGYHSQFLLLFVLLTAALSWLDYGLLGYRRLRSQTFS